MKPTGDWSIDHPGQDNEPDDDIHVHVDESAGMTMKGATVIEITSGNGQHYWKATQDIESLFGSEVEGEIEAIGRTKEEALERLSAERKKLNDSLWI